MFLSLKLGARTIDWQVTKLLESGDVNNWASAERFHLFVHIWKSPAVETPKMGTSSEPSELQTGRHWAFYIQSMSLTHFFRLQII